MDSLTVKQDGVSNTLRFEGHSFFFFLHGRSFWLGHRPTDPERLDCESNCWNKRG